MGLLSDISKDFSMDMMTGYGGSAKEIADAEDAYDKKKEREDAIKSQTGIKGMASSYMNGMSSGLTGGMRRLPHQPRCQSDGCDGPEFG